MQRRAVRHGFVRRNGAIGFLARNLPQHFDNRRHAAGAADEQDTVNVSPFEAGGLQRLPRGKRRAIEQVAGHVFELLSRDFDADGVPLKVARNCSFGSGGECSLGVFAFAP